MRMSIVTTPDEWKEGDHLVSEEIYNEIALLILARTHPEWMSKGTYSDGMNLYGAIISLQEASRWLESGFIDHAKTDLAVALKQLHEIADRDREKKK